MTEQNRKYVTKEIGKLLSEIWRIKGLAEQEYGPQHPITKKLASMHEDAQKLLGFTTEAALHSPEALSKMLDICVTPQDLEEMVLW